MAFVSRNEFIQQQAQRQERAQNRANEASRTRVGYFSLKDDGDEAIVRFAYSSPDDLEIFTTHQVTIDGKFRRVNCLRSFKDPFDMCPLCAAGQNNQQRTYIKLIEYVRNEDGTVTPTPKIWERPVSYVQILTNLFTEYGDISDCVFKVKRSGERGSMQTTYSIMFGNPAIYNSQLYVKDFTAFDDYKILGGPLMDKSYNELSEMVAESTPTAEPTRQTFTPQAAQVEKPVETPTNPFSGGQRRITY